MLCGLLIAPAAVASVGPCNDLTEAGLLLEKTAARAIPRRLFADKGYDAEWVHVFCRETMGTQSVVAPIVRTKDGSIKTKYRSMMNPLPPEYGKRWAVESYFSAMKRVLGGALRALKPSTRASEGLMKVLAYNLRRED